MLQWILVAILVYVIYYLINKYEKRVDELNKLIELNREEIMNNRKKIEENKEKIVQNETSIKTNRERLDLNQDIISKLK